MRFSLPTRKPSGRTMLDCPVGRLEAHLQPQVDLVDGTVVGAELLIRWRHPQEGLVLPGSFLPFLDDDEHAELLRVVLAEAVDVLAADDGLIPAVSVNAEPLSLDEHVSAYVLGLLADTGVDPGRLKVELTEGSPGASASVMACLETLAAGGVRISMDDFGTGYSSMHRLHAVEAHELKVDRALFQATVECPRAATIVRAVTALGAELGAATVAEGIETEADAALAVELGFAIGQGYHWSPAVPVEALRSWIVARSAGQRAAA